MTTTEIEHVSPTIRRGNGRGKVRLLTRRSLDGRTHARKQFAAIVDGIIADLGGQDQLSTVQLWLIEAFASAALVCQHSNAKLLLGESVDLTEHSAAVSTMVRLASRIGVARIPRNVAPSVASYLAELAK